MKWLLSVLLVAFAVAGSACGEACSLIPLPGIEVTVIDAATGDPFVEEVTVIATEGSYTETVSPPILPAGPRTAALAVERPGTYRIEVQAPGYTTWVATNVRVTQDGCHVEAVELTAELEPSGTA